MKIQENGSVRSFSKGETYKILITDFIEREKGKRLCRTARGKGEESSLRQANN